MTVNADKVAREKSSMASTGAFFAITKEVLFMFPKHVGIKDCNDMGVLDILEAIRISSSSFKERLMVERDSSNEHHKVSYSDRALHKFNFYLNEIKFLITSLQVSFAHVGQSANGLANTIAKQGVDMIVPLIASIL